MVDLPNGKRSLVQVVTSSYINSYKNIDKQTIETIRGNRHYNSIDAENIKSFVAPVINNDDNSSIKIEVSGEVNAPVVIINNTDAKMIFENADFIKRVISGETKQNEDDRFFEKVLIKMHKAIDSKKQVKDSAYCDDILKGKAIATIIENNEDKQEILRDPFNNLFLVDIEVVRADNEIKLYRVVKLHNIIPKD